MPRPPVPGGVISNLTSFLLRDGDDEVEERNAAGQCQGRRRQVTNENNMHGAAQKSTGRVADARTSEDLYRKLVGLGIFSFDRLADFLIAKSDLALRYRRR